MKSKLSNNYPQKWAQIIVLVGLCFTLYFVNLNQWDLWNPDEPRYAQVAREMAEGGDWILMHYNGSVYNDKPPLFFWLIALSSYLWQGFSSFAVRFPAALFGTLTVIITFFLGRLLYGRRTGFLSALVLATSFEFVYLSTRGNIDTTLTFFTTGSLFCFFEWYRGIRDEGKGKGEVKEKKKDWSIYGFYAGMALATLAKGPVGFILPLLTGLTCLAVQRDWKALREMKLLSGLLLFLVVVLSWYLPAVLKGGREYLEATLLHHSAARFAKGTSHIRPFYYFFYNFPIHFLPWTLFLPGAIVYGFSQETLKKRKEFLHLLAWSVVIFLFFSVSRGKRTLYLLPLFPAVSLMVGKLWDDYITSPMEHFNLGWISFPLYGLMGLTLAAGGAILWTGATRFSSYYLAYVFPMAFLLVGFSLSLFALSRSRHHGALLLVLVGMMVAGFFYTFRVGFPLINPFKSARFISGEILSRIEPGEKLAVYGDFETGPYNYYTGIVPILELEGDEALSRFLKSPERVYCLIRPSDLAEIRTKEGLPIVEKSIKYSVGHRDMILISNR